MITYVILIAVAYAITYVTTYAITYVTTHAIPYAITYAMTYAVTYSITYAITYAITYVFMYAIMYAMTDVHPHLNSIPSAKPHPQPPYQASAWSYRYLQLHSTTIDHTVCMKCFIGFL